MITVKITMTRDVMLAMKGMQFELAGSGAGDNIEIIAPAQYFEKGDHSYIKYDEIMEGVENAISNLIRFDDKSIEVTKKGDINVHMVFEEGKQNLTNYQTPFGTLVVGIDTHRVEIVRSENKIHLQADYGLDINYEFLTDCKIVMDIEPKDELHLI